MKVIACEVWDVSVDGLQAGFVGTQRGEYGPIPIFWMGIDQQLMDLRFVDGSSPVYHVGGVN